MMKKIPSFPRSGECACYTVLDLFSGIGGFSLGLTRAGFRTTAFCEIEEYPRSILRKHWPDVPIFNDVRELHASDLPEPIDLICGGYPCQPFSVAGQRKGKDDDRHLWPEIVRIIRELDATTGKPAWCIFENVAGHVSMGLDQVLSDLEGEGYAAWPFIIPACALNAPHRRDRVWIVAHDESRLDGEHNSGTMQRQKPEPRKSLGLDTVSDTSRQGLEKREVEQQGGAEAVGASSITDPASERPFPRAQAGIYSQEESGGSWNVKLERHCPPPANANHPRPQGRGELGEQDAKRQAPGRNGHDFAGSDFGKLTNTEWITLPGVRARNDGLPGRVARLKALGNAVVPQIPELIGRCILSV